MPFFTVKEKTAIDNQYVKRVKLKKLPGMSAEDTRCEWLPDNSFLSSCPPTVDNFFWSSNPQLFFFEHQYTNFELWTTLSRWAACHNLCNPPRPGKIVVIHQGKITLSGAVMQLNASVSPSWYMAVIDKSAKSADHLVQNHNRMKKENLNTDPCTFYASQKLGRAVNHWRRRKTSPHPLSPHPHTVFVYRSHW